MPRYQLSTEYVDQELEQSLIAAIVADPKLYLDVMSHTPVEAFVAEPEAFSRVGIAIEGDKPLPTIPEWQPSVEPLQDAQRLNTKYQCRLFADALQTGIEGLRDKVDDNPLSHIDVLVEKLTDIIQLTHEQHKQRVESVVDLWSEVSTDLHQRRKIIEETGSTVIGIESGVSPTLDELMGGLQNGLFVVASRPSLGKTSLATQLSLSSCKQGIPCLFLSFEEPKQRLAVRAVCSLSGLVAKDYFDGREDPTTLDQAFRHHQDIFSHFHIVEPYKGIAFNHIRDKAHQLVIRYKREKEHRKLLIVVDYLQLVARSMRSNPNSDFRFDVGSIANQFRTLGISDIGCPVVILSAINRASEGKPGLEHLSESDQIGYDADAVLTLSINDERDAGDGSSVDLTVTKNRWGGTGTIPLHFRKDIGRFSEVEITEDEY